MIMMGESAQRTKCLKIPSNPQIGSPRANGLMPGEAVIFRPQRLETVMTTRSQNHKQNREIQATHERKPTNQGRQSDHASSRSGAPAAKAMSPTRRQKSVRPKVSKRDNQRQSAPADSYAAVEQVMKMAVADPIGAAIICARTIACSDQGHQTELRKFIAAAYAIARALHQDKTAWGDFLASRFWDNRKKKPKSKDRSNPLLHVMAWVFRATDRTKYQRASKYAIALKELWEQKVPADQVATRISNAGGIENLYKQNKATKIPRELTRRRLLKFCCKLDAFAEKISQLEEGEEAIILIRGLVENKGVVAEITRVKIKTEQ
jgi:hypothetical protein